LGGTALAGCFSALRGRTGVAALPGGEGAVEAAGRLVCSAEDGFEGALSANFTA
jgi:hypothetical protein